MIDHQQASADAAPEWVSAIAAAAGVIVAIVAIVFAGWQLKLTARQLRETALREAQNSDDQTRPYVFADFVMSLAGPPIIDVVIENSGRTVAREIKMRLVGDGFGAQSASDTIGPTLGRLFDAGFDLAPGARRRLMWRLPDQPNAEPRGDMGAPASVAVVLNYKWEPGKGRSPQEFEEHLAYDLTDYLKVAPIPFQGERASGNDETTRNAVNALRAIAQHTAEARR